MIATEPVDQLAQLNAKRRRQVEALRDAKVAAHRERAVVSLRTYPLLRLKDTIAEALRERAGRPEVVADISVISRRQFGGDLMVKVPALLKEGGARTYIARHVPWMVEILQSERFREAIAEVQTKGIYINLRLTDRWLLDSLQVVAELGPRFGENDSQSERTVVLDYSSPNVAKMLHAGHIRSTIIGHVLANLHEACGALVYRLNHVNDFGGFGFLLEGVRRFDAAFPGGLSKNERLLAVYAIRRALERAAEAGLAPAELAPHERELIVRYLPSAATAEDLRAAFAAFEAASNARFERLEAGDAEEVSAWQDMVHWSLSDFQTFYDALDIHIDFTLGESFYYHAGDALVTAWLADGRAVVFAEALAAREIGRLNDCVAAGDMTPAERDKRAESVRKDVGATVVVLRHGERFVVRRADGRSIYATRDLGAIQLRREIFDPTDMTYVVGQEQKVHFARLFLAAEVTGLVLPEEVRLKHLYFGFYVDAGTRKKLSSRESVANVNQLLSASVEHFRQRIRERGDHSDEELEEAARQLAIGSLVFNDLKQDMKGAVEIATEDLNKTISDFEKSGGAYVVYTACRARSILRKYGQPLPHARDVQAFELTAEEATLILKLQELPERVANAAEQSDPVALIRYLLDLASAYNPYYASSPVLRREGANLSRLLLTKAIEQTLTNGLSHCHIKCPPRI